VIDDREAQLIKTAPETGYAQGGRAHVHTPAALAEIERSSDYGDVRGFHGK
jgi:hypothetical protein